MQKGVDPNIKTRDGKTPLSLAVGRSQGAAATELLNYFADINQLSNGTQPLLEAVRRQDKHMTMLLLDRGARVDQAVKRASAQLIPANQQLSTLIHRAETQQVSDRYRVLMGNMAMISNQRSWQHPDHWWGDYASRLGTEGYCYGVSHMWGQALLANDLSTFNKRFALLTHNYQILPFTTASGRQIDSLRALIEEAIRCKHNPGEFKVMSSLDGSWVSLDLVMSIRTFLDGLLLYLDPAKTALHADNPSYRLAGQNAQRVAQYVGNQAMGRQGEDSGFATLYQHAFVGDKAELERFLAPVVGEMRQTKAPFFIEFGKIGHSIALSYTSDGYVLSDANLLQQQINPPPNGIF